MVTIQMHEWERLTAHDEPALAGLDLDHHPLARAISEDLTQKDILEVLELRNGISVRSTSFVGRIELGDLQITIRPKIRHNMFVTLLRYAYHLRDIRLMADTKLEAEPDAFQDILIECLLAETSELISRGLHRQYRRLDAELPAPKGRIDVQRLALRNSTVQADIPVIYHLRLEDCLINQVLLAGLHFAVRLTTDLALRTRLRRVAGTVQGEVTHLPVLDLHILQRVRREMSRLTAHYVPSITLIELLVRSTGITLQDSNRQVKLPGLLFDMNHFFERLITRFLSEHLSEFEVYPQSRLMGLMSYDPEHNPRRRQAPTPRPDLVIKQGTHLIALLDAKYRDLWESALPREMLYQLAVYALSQGRNGKAVILYPTTEDSPKPQIIAIQDPLVGEQKAQIILRPVNLSCLSSLLRETGRAATHERVQYAKFLVLG